MQQMEPKEFPDKKEACRSFCKVDINKECNTAANEISKDEVLPCDDNGVLRDTYSEQKSDFRQSFKYKDTKSYDNQHHHSIGTGLYLTDEIRDLPPRFRNKVINALETAAALNNIPLNKVDPVNLLSIVSDNVSSDVHIDPSVAASGGKNVHQVVPGSVAKDNEHIFFYHGIIQQYKSASSENTSQSCYNKQSSGKRAQDLNDRRVKSHYSGHNSDFQFNKRSVKKFFSDLESKNKVCASSIGSRRSSSEFISPSSEQLLVVNEDTATVPISHSEGNLKMINNSKNICKELKKVPFHQSKKFSNENALNFVGSKINDAATSTSFSPKKQNESTVRPGKKTSSYTQKSQNNNVFAPVTVGSGYSKNANFPSKKYNKSEVSPNLERNSTSSGYDDRRETFNSERRNNVGNLRRNHEIFYNSKRFPYKVPKTDSENFADISKKTKAETVYKNLLRYNSSNFEECSNRRQSYSRSLSSSSGPDNSFKDPGELMDFTDKLPSSKVSEYSTINSSALLKSNKIGFCGEKPPLHNTGTKSQSLNRNLGIKSRYNTGSNFSHHNKAPATSDASTPIKINTYHSPYHDRANKESMFEYPNSAFCEITNEKLNKNLGENKELKNPRQKSSDYAISNVSNLKSNDFRSVSDISEYSDGRQNHNFERNRQSKENGFNKSARHADNVGRINRIKDNGKTDERCFKVDQPSLEHKPRGCIDDGFFLKVEVSDDDKNLEYWLRSLKNLFSFQFDVERCCNFSNILILAFETKAAAEKGCDILWKEKKKMKNSDKPHIISISKVKYHIIKPCNCKEKVISACVRSIEKSAESSLRVIWKKIKEIKGFRYNRNQSAKSKEVILAIDEIDEMFKTLNDSESNFTDFKKNTLSEVEKANNLKSIQGLKLNFIRECNIFIRCLPIYSRKNQILNSVRFYSVSVIIAETGSGKSTQIAEYLMHSDFANRGLIICTQPRKLAAISIAQFVSGQVGSAVGKIVGYDVGTERRCSKYTKIIYMTDYQLLREFLKNPNLKGISCIIIDEAHERSLYTDLLLGMLKKCLQTRLDLRAIITSATINPSIFIDYFDLSPTSIIKVPGRSYPVEVIWWDDDVDLGWNYVGACVKKAYEIHTKQKPGDILVFLTSPSESEEAIFMLKRLLYEKDEKPLLFCLHGKSDLHEQMQIFQSIPQKSRKIIFATNIAETSVTIPGIKYVVDSGMTKELFFDPKKNKNYLAVTFINKSSAEQRKGRAGRTQSGVCYRMYSKYNFDKCMSDSSVPEILRTNLQKALLKIFELGINPEYFDFIETPPKRSISDAINSLEYLGAIESDKLTDLGKKLAKFSIEPQLAKLVFQGIKADMAYEAIIIAALVSESGKLFIRGEENKSIVDETKKKFCHEGGDLCTYLEIYKRWKDIDIPNRYTWCVENYISSKALYSATKTIKEIITCLRTEFSIRVFQKYNNDAFKKRYEKVLFDSFSENLCVSSGHPKLGYLSPYLSESFFIHPSSTLSYLGKDIPEYLVYSTLMETSRNFLFDITPISEETIKLAYQSGSFTLPLHSLKYLQIPPKIMGPYGESVLIRYILGKQGFKIKELETKIKNIINAKNIHIDVTVDKGLITFYAGQHFHQKVSNVISEIIEQAHCEMLKEEDVIKLSGGALYYALCAGGLINDIIMPGESRELILNAVPQKHEVEHLLESYGPLQSVQKSVGVRQVCVTYKKVCDAFKAYFDLKEKKFCNVISKPYLPNVNDKSLPLYMLEVSWCRFPCTGSGWIEFSSEEDLIQASGILTFSSFFLGDNYVYFTPSDRSTKQLYMKNLPKTVNENEIKVKLKECLPQDLLIKKIIILRTQSNKVTDADIKNVKQKLMQIFGCYSASNKLVIDVQDPQQNDIVWKACVYFENTEDGERTYKKLKDCAMIDSFKLSIEQVLKSSINCTNVIYHAVKMQVTDLLKNKQYCETFNVQEKENSVTIEFMSSTIHKLNFLRQKLMLFLQGESLDFIGISRYHFLFSENMRNCIELIQTRTNTVIHLNKFRKVVTIYGSLSGCRKAKEEIYSVISDSNLSSTRTFNLMDSCIPRRFMKTLYMKYGYDLHGLVNTFLLSDAKIDTSRNTLTLSGAVKNIKQAEQALEKLCEELYESRHESRQLSNEEEICPICLDPVSYDFQRLEHCGHAFCRQCLLLQVESKTIPLVCAKQNCEKLIFLEDIKRIISLGESQLKKSFCATALQYHVSTNVGKISYCPTPDCQMIYRITEQGSEYNCSICRNSICTHCRTLYHYGMSCDMFQNRQKDEDYSLKAWMNENKSERKYCPSCKIVIEKADGCNHMECLNCKVHLC